MSKIIEASIFITIMSVVIFPLISVSQSFNEIKTVQAKEQVQAVQEVDNDIIETASIDAPTKIVYSETVKVKSVYYDEFYSNWYVVADGWALEGTEQTAKNAKDEKVKVEYYVVDGQEIILSWGVVDNNGNYKLEIK